jgi:hypothetical protein
MASAIARAIAAGGIAIFSIHSTIWVLKAGSVMEVARFVWTNPDEILVTRSLSPASCRSAGDEHVSLIYSILGEVRSFSATPAVADRREGSL